MNTVKHIDFSKVLLQEAAFLELSIKNSTSSATSENNKVFSFKSKVSHHKTFNLQENGLKIELHVECSALNKESEPIGIEGRFHLGFAFKVDNLEEYSIQIPEKNETIPAPELVIPLLGTAYSTARGMIIVKALGTVLEGFSLPIVNAQSLLLPAEEPKAKKKSSKTL